MIPNIPDTPQLFAESTWITPLIIFGLYLLASVISLLSFRIVRLILRVARFVSRKQQHIDPDHDRKISLLSGLIRLIAYILATLGSVSLFVDSASLVWFVGLFSAGFGIAARPIISDYLTGISLIFEGPFEVGEKVELPGVLGGSVEGVVEKIRLRTTTIRARSGEPIIVPNGEVRAIRNFSRANYSESKIKIHIRSKDARKAVDLLEAMSNDAVMLFENLIEPWRVLSETGEIGSQTVLTVAFRSKFGKAAIVRPKLLYIIQEKFEAANILLEN